MKYLGSYLYYLINNIYKIMDRKEEINKEIDLLEKRIISLKNERYDIIKKENPIYVGDCFVQFRRIGNAYYKIVKNRYRSYLYYGKSQYYRKRIFYT